MKKQYFKKWAGRVPTGAGLYMWMCVLGVCLMCGCTKKEQLLPEEEAVVILQSGESDDGKTPEDTDAGANPEDTDAGANREIYVHICGAVNNPGVFTLPEGSRLFDAVAAAGGFSEDASADFINQAQTVMDGCRIQIPTKEEAEAIAGVQEDSDMTELLIQEDGGKSTGHTGEEAGKKVNINEADAPQLCTINGIGEGRASAIIRYRETHGRFARIEEIMNVDGIKQGTFEKIRDQISVK